MCRILGYLGPTIGLEQLLYKPEHSLIVQSYQPREMSSGLLNADGFGIGWYDRQKTATPYRYRNTLPIWSDLNLPQLSRYIQSSCILGYVRSATEGQSLDFINCQPFSDHQLSFLHNGFIANFRQTLYRPIRSSFDDYTYQLVQGTTDSEHIFGLIVNRLRSASLTLTQAVRGAIAQLSELVKEHNSHLSANIVLSDGKQLIATRYASPESTTPSLYWLRDDALFPEAVIVASEPLFGANWKYCPEYSILSVGEDLEVSIAPIP